MYFQLKATLCVKSLYASEIAIFGVRYWFLGVVLWYLLGTEKIEKGHAYGQVDAVWELGVNRLVTLTGWFIYPVILSGSQLVSLCVLWFLSVSSICVLCMHTGSSFAFVSNSASVDMCAFYSTTYTCLARAKIYGRHYWWRWYSALWLPLLDS